MFFEEFTNVFGSYRTKLPIDGHTNVLLTVAQTKCTAKLYTVAKIVC